MLDRGLAHSCDCDVNCWILQLRYPSHNSLHDFNSFFNLIVCDNLGFTQSAKSDAKLIVSLHSCQISISDNLRSKSFDWSFLYMYRITEIDRHTRFAAIRAMVERNTCARFGRFLSVQRTIHTSFVKSWLHFTAGQRTFEENNSAESTAGYH